MTNRSFLRLIGCLALCLGVALANGSVTYPEIPTWYASLTKPSWTPPDWVFPIVWSALYVMMGVSLWLVWDRAAGTPERQTTIRLFLLQLGLNAAWSPVFFGLHHTRAALAIILLLASAITATILAAWRTQRLAALLLAPYLAWVVYAATLNAAIVTLNV